MTYDLRTRALHEYLFLLDDPKAEGTAVSEIAAVSNDTFLVDERDGNFPAAGGYKKLWRISLDGATDVGPRRSCPGRHLRPGERRTAGRWQDHRGADRG